MLLRSLTLAATLALASPALLADSSPLDQERWQTRPLVVLARDAGDPDLRQFEQTLAQPANKEALTKRDMVLFTIVGVDGKRDGKPLDAQSTMALIRDLKLGASAKTRVVLFGKDGEKKLEREGQVNPKDFFDAVDQMPMAESERPAQAAAPAEPEAKGKDGKPVAAPVGGPGRSAKAVKSGKPAEQPDE